MTSACQSAPIAFSVFYKFIFQRLEPSRLVFCITGSQTFRAQIYVQTPRGVKNESTVFTPDMKDIACEWRKVKEKLKLQRIYRILLLFNAAN